MPLLPSDPFFAEEATFNAHTAAEAQFWTTKDDAPGLIVTLPKVGYEFSTNQWVGRDPGGLFSYNDLSDIPTDGQTNFKVTTKGLGRRTYVTVVFYNDKNEVFGRFVGADPAQVAKASGLVDKTGKGSWTQPPIGSTDAIFRKVRGENIAHVIGGATPWIAEFKLAGDFAEKKSGEYSEKEKKEIDEYFVEKEFEIKGDLRYRKQSLIKRGIYVRWISDHLIFFENNVRSKGYNAYFMARDDTELTELLPADHTHEDLTAGDLTVCDVKWSYHDD